MIVEFYTSHIIYLCFDFYSIFRALSTHLLLHTKEKRHACRICAVKFKRTDHRNRHEMTAHGVNFKTHKALDAENVPLINN